MKTFLRLLLTFALFPAFTAFGADNLPSQKEYEPKDAKESKDGKGPVVVLVSGQTGPNNYTEMAKALADAGFYAVLVDGNDFWIKGGGGEALLKGVIQRAQASPKAAPGKVGVVGFSLGGASVLTYAARMPELVGAVVAQYPLTSFITDPVAFVGKVQVPTLLLVGTADTYKDCCLIAKARELAEASKAGAEPRKLEVFEYRWIDHGFSTDNSTRRDIRADSLKRTAAHLRQHLTGS